MFLTQLPGDPPWKLMSIPRQVMEWLTEDRPVTDWLADTTEKKKKSALHIVSSRHQATHLKQRHRKVCGG